MWISNRCMKFTTCIFQVYVQIIFGQTNYSLNELFEAVKFEVSDVEILFLASESIKHIEINNVPTEYIALVKVPLNEETTNLDVLQIKNNTGNIFTFIIPTNASSLVNVISKISVLETLFINHRWRKPIYMILWQWEGQLKSTEGSTSDSSQSSDVLSYNPSDGKASILTELQSITLDSALYILYDNSHANNHAFSEDIKASESVNSAKGTFPTKYYIQEVYSIKKHNFIHFLYSNGKSTHIYDLIATHHRRQDFNGVPISGTAQEHPDRKKAADFSFPNNTPKFEGGFEVFVYWYLRDALNFKEKAVVGSGWVSQLPNGTLLGMAAQVISSEADISISSSEILMHLTTQLEFLIPTYLSNMWAFFRQPSALSIRNVFTQAFKTELWILILSTWTLVLIVMFLFSRIKAKQGSSNYFDLEISNNSFMWTFCLICQHGWYSRPEAVSMKIIYLSGLFTALLTYVAYSAKLISILSVSVIPIKSFSDILSYKYTIYSDKFLIDTHFSRNNENSKLETDPTEIITMDALPGIVKLLNTRGAFFDIADSFYVNLRRYAANLNTSRAEETACEQVSVVQVNRKKGVGGTFIKKDSPLKELFNYKILTMYERGVRYRLLTTYFEATGMKCADSVYRSNQNDAFGLTELFTAFAMLMVLHVVSIVLLIFERLSAKSFKQKLTMIWETEMKNN